MATKRKAAAPAIVSLWSCASGAAIIECDVETVLELKAALQQDIVVADAHGTIIPSGCGLPVSSKDEPILVFPVVELDRFLSDRKLPIGWAGLGRIARLGQRSPPEQILIWICMGDRVVKMEDNHPARTFSALFADFCGSSAERAAWQQPSALLFWTAFPPALALDAFMVRSVQKSRNCYLHAPVMLQHMLVVKHSGNANHTKIDISMYMRERLHEDALKEYLQARGGSSIDVLATIADLDEVDMDIVRVSPRPAQLRRYSNREWLA